MFKLSQGEYIATEKVELALLNNQYVGQIFLYGDSRKSYLVAVVVPDPLELVPLLKQGFVKGFETDSPFYKEIPTLSTDLSTWLPPFAKLCAPETQTGVLINDFLLSELTKQGKIAKFLGFEFVKKIYVEGSLNNLMQGFSVENNCLTPTFKLKRPNIRERYQVQLQEMYAS
mmetsp:Transcript_14244/g.18469  ORF Transcript_14244/g.18469 Transcript_14244/m.18469 type:complete len:172 (+) Transcript_14244:1140-1655(+)